MSEMSPALGLTWLKPNQAQKHVALNETLGQLDVLVQMVLEQVDVSQPPAAPADGKAWAIGAAPTGAWTGKAGQLALWRDHAWRFLTLRAGWRAFVLASNRMMVWTGAGWVDPAPVPVELQGLQSLGLGTQADAANPLAARLNGALFTARAQADGGNGDVRLTLNKEAVGDTVSMVLQTSYSGRAEIGLAGNDDLVVKTSGDGNVWVEALKIERATGQVRFPNSPDVTAAINAAGQASAAASAASNAASIANTAASTANTAASAANAAAGAASSLRLAALAAQANIATRRITQPSGSFTPSVYVPIVWVAGATYTLEVRFKAGEAFRLNLHSNAGAVFDCIADGAAGTITGAGNTMEAVGSGWWVARVPITASASTSANLQLRILGATGGVPINGDGVSGLFVDHVSLKNAAGTELLTTGDISNAYWIKLNCTVSAVTITNNNPTPALALNAYNAIVGSMTADKIVEGTGTVSPGIFRGVTPTNGAAHEHILDVKAAGRSRFNLYNNGGFFYDVDVNLDTATIAKVGSTPAGHTVSIEHLGEAWYRCRVAGLAGGATGGNSQIRLRNAVNAAPYAGDGASGLLIHDARLLIAGVDHWGADRAAFATSAWNKLGSGGAATTVSANVGLYRTIKLDGPGNATIASPHPLSGKKLSLVGTSLVAGGLLTSALASETGASIQQLGFSGGALGLDARGTPHYGSGQVTALFASINADAEVILLDMPVNDMGGSEVPLGAIGDTTTATYYGALANFFAWCEANRPNAAVCVVVPTAAAPGYVGTKYRHGVANYTGAMVEDYQAATRRAALYAGRPFIDPNAFGIGYLDMETGEATGDGLHWDASGSGKIAKIYAKQLKDFCDAGWLVAA